MAPEIPRSQFLGSVNAILCGKSDFVDMIVKDLEIEQLSCIIWMGLKCNDRCC